MLLEEIESQLKSGRDIEDILKKYDWKKFENIVAQIFQENGFYTKQNFRFKTKKRYEIDILAVKNDRIFCIDCKWWSNGRYKKSSIKHAISLQKNRTIELMKFLKKNVIVKELLGVHNLVALPLLVTLHEEDIIIDDGTYVVPAWKLNRFLLEF